MNEELSRERIDRIKEIIRLEMVELMGPRQKSYPKEYAQALAELKAEDQKEKTS